MAFASMKFVCSLYELVEDMVADAVLRGAVRERAVPDRFSVPHPDVALVAEQPGERRRRRGCS